MSSKKLNLICQFCQSSFITTLDHGKIPKYCSRSCYYRGIKGKPKKKKPDIVNTCQNCNIEFVSRKTHRTRAKYCSRKCAQKGYQTGINKLCLNCGTEFYSPNWKQNTKNHGKYCSLKCKHLFLYKTSLDSQCPGSYRKNAWRIFEKKCYDCGYSLHPEILLIHHIDGNRKNGKLENLIPVCQNCHCLRHIVLSGNYRLPSYTRHNEK